jgi:hypothetical protein
MLQHDLAILGRALAPECIERGDEFVAAPKLDRYSVDTQLEAVAGVLALVRSEMIGE